MKKTLFRGKRLDNNKWIYGYLVDTCYGLSIVTEPLHHIDCAEWNVTCYEVIPETVGQHTAYKDINNQDIYKGDIVRIANDEIGSPVPPGFTGVVVFREGRWQVDNGTTALDLWQEIIQWEIIGNRFDNPELLPER